MLDHIAVTVDGSAGCVSQITRDHFNVALALNIPLFLVITKMDVMSEDAMLVVLKDVLEILKSAHKEPLIIDSNGSITPDLIQSKTQVPIFITSSVTGEFIDYIRHYLFLSPCYRRIKKSKRQEDFEFVVDEVYDVPEVGTVVSGVVCSGSLSLDHTLRRYAVGPDVDGSFKTASIVSIHRNRVPINSTNPGERITIALNGIAKCQIKRGMVVVEESKSLNKLCSEFEMKASVSQNIAECKKGIVCVRGSRQAGVITSVRSANGETFVRIKLLKRPLCVNQGLTVFFWHGKSKAIGTISAIYTHK